MGLVVDRLLLAFGSQYLAAHFGKRAIGSFADVNDFLVGVGFYDVSVLAFQDLGEQPNEFLFSVACAGANGRRMRVWPSQ